MHSSPPSCINGYRGELNAGGGRCWGEGGVILPCVRTGRIQVGEEVLIPVIQRCLETGINYGGPTQTYQLIVTSETRREAMCSAVMCTQRTVKDG